VETKHRDMYYVANVRLECLKSDLGKCVKEMPKLATEKGDLVSFHCHIYYPYYDLDEGFSLKVWLTEEERFINIDPDIIKKRYRAGWPRAGIMAERYLDFPWRLLKRVKEFLAKPLDISVLIRILKAEQVHDGLDITRYYDENIQPWFEKLIGKMMFEEGYDLERDIDVLKRHYEKAIEINKKQMLEAFSVSREGYPYLGVVVNPALFEIDDDNPFRDYLKTCVDWQKQKLGDHKPSM
jgi:hypothetical protein